MAAWMKSQGAAPTATLLDADGRIGRAYGARTTPHMYVIDARGTLVYAGGIDDKPSANPADVKTATNHVNAALADVLAGRAGGAARHAALWLLGEVRGWLIDGPGRPAASPPDGRSGRLGAARRAGQGSVWYWRASASKARCDAAASKAAPSSSARIAATAPA